MAPKRKKRAKLNFIALVLSGLVVAFCVLTTLGERYGLDMELPEISLPAFSALTDLIDEAAGGGGTASRPPASPGGNADAVPEGSGAPDLAVHFLDVGQGKSILIQAPEGNVLIDAGENNMGKQVVGFLRAHNATSLDIVIGTHPHSDHIGGLDVVIEEMNVKSVILPDIPDEIVPTTLTYTDLLMAIAKKGLKVTPAKPDDTYALGSDTTITILAPVAQYRDLNNMSVVARLDHKDTSFLFTGDIEYASESDLMTTGAALRTDVLDVAHHGSSTSGALEFLERVSPRIAVISCGVDNSYGHPHREVVERLQSLGTSIARTDLDGTVTVYSDGSDITFIREK